LGHRVYINGNQRQECFSVIIIKLFDAQQK
jgi:hypothetical protein